MRAAQNSIISTVRVEQSLGSKKHVESGRTSGPICMQLPSETLLVLWQSSSVEHAPWTIKGMTQSACSTRKAGGICPGLPRCSVLQQSTGKQSGRYPTWHPQDILVDRVQQPRLSSEALAHHARTHCQPLCPACLSLNHSSPLLVYVHSLLTLFLSSCPQ